MVLMIAVAQPEICTLGIIVNNPLIVSSTYIALCLPKGLSSSQIGENSNIPEGRGRKGKKLLTGYVEDQ